MVENFYHSIGSEGYVDMTRPCQISFATNHEYGRSMPDQPETKQISHVTSVTPNVNKTKSSCVLWSLLVSLAIVGLPVSVIIFTNKIDSLGDDLHKIDHKIDSLHLSSSTESWTTTTHRPPFVKVGWGPWSPCDCSIPDGGRQRRVCNSGSDKCIGGDTETRGCYDDHRTLVTTSCSDETIEKLLTSSLFYLRSPNYPRAFGNFGLCIFEVYNPCPKEYKFLVSFDIFDLGSVANLTIEETGHQTKIYSGSQIPPPYESRSITNQTSR